MVVPLSFGVVRPIHSSRVQLTRAINSLYLYTRAPLSILRNGSTRFGPIFQASLHSNSGTGTSEGIPRVCFKATEPRSRNKRLNTSLLIRSPRPWGECNILIDAGKFFIRVL